MKKYSILFPAILFLFSCGNGNDESKNEGGDSVRVQSAGAMSHEEMEMKEMAERQKDETPKESPYKNAKIDIKVFENKEANLTGFGYDILIYDALYVHQPHIPAINGNRGFKTKDQATKAAEFVIYKIRNNIMPPSLGVEELDSLGTLK
ncbi:MAG: DUF4907 domain-containing protein [Bacteroidetes bacterium]|nr:MAG: DUF4907 domain-containing protein [Bacteroidota bacterium]